MKAKTKKSSQNQENGYKCFDKRDINHRFNDEQHGLHLLLLFLLHVWIKTHQNLFISILSFNSTEKQLTIIS